MNLLDYGKANKKGNNAATVDVKTPTSTSKTGNGKVSFDNNIPLNAGKSNTKFSLKENYNRAAELNIANTKDGRRILYDINNVKKLMTATLPLFRQKAEWARPEHQLSKIV